MPEPSLTIALENLCFIVVKAREFDVKDAPVIEDPGSNPADDDEREVLEDRASDPAQEELSGFIDSLNDDEKIDLVALTWLGRGDGDAEGWAELRAQASERHGERHTASYLLGIPLLADYLEEAMQAFDLSCEDV